MFFKSAMILMLSSLAVSCSSAPTTTASSSGLQIDLKAFRDVAIKRIHAKFRQAVITEDGGIWFQDGAAATDDPIESDVASVEFLFRVRGMKLPSPRFWYTYSAKLNGTSEIRGAALDADGSAIDFFDLSSGIASLSADASGGAIKKLARSLEKRFPGTKIQPLETIKALTYTTTPAGSLRLVHALKASRLIREAKMAAINYPVPFHFGKPVALGSGTESRLVDIEPLRSVNHDERDRGRIFRTYGSLPAPLGQGLVLNPEASHPRAPAAE